MTRVLIVGIDSSIGFALAAALAQRGDSVVGTSRRQSRLVADRICLDLASPEASLTRLPPADVAVFCAAMAKFAECRDEPALAHRVNVEGPLALAHRLVAAGTRVVLLSTSAVFDGTRPQCRADEPPCPRTAYGRFKAEAEASFLSLGPAASVLRLTKVVTPNMPLFAGWAQALSLGHPVRAFGDLYFCPLQMTDVVNALIAILDDGRGGIWQVSGSHDLSYANAGYHLAKSLGTDIGLIQTVGAVESGIAPDQILRYSSLDTTRLSELTGFVPPEPLSLLSAIWSSYRAAAPVVAGV